MSQHEVVFNPELLDKARARKIVSSFQKPEVSPAKIIDNILHKVGLGSNAIYPGKVTTCVVLPDHHMRIHIRRPSLSTHDIIRSEFVPYKDETVSLINNTIIGLIEGVIPVAQRAQSDFGLSDQSPITVQHDCKPVLYEHVLREYMAVTDTETSLYHQYAVLGKRNYCGHIFPEGLLPNQKLDRVYDTPSTKENIHDVSVPISHIYARGIITPDVYENILLPASLKAFEIVSKFMNSRNLILVDTKLEFGTKKSSGEYCATDELFTLDSSRYWYKNLDGSIMKEDDQKENSQPVSFSKQFARNMARGSEMFTKEQEDEVAVQYIIAAQLITGQLFNPIGDDYEKLLEDDISKVLSKL